MNTIKKSIGSYFALEIQKLTDNFYYPDSIMLNTGRNALEYIIKALNVEKIYLPLFSCDAIYTPINRQGIEYEFYNIDEDLNPIFDFGKCKKNEYFLYINYFGIKSRPAKSLSSKIQNLIIDNSQAFFCKPIRNIPTFYSTRKFFGVSDGALLLNVQKKIRLDQDKSAERMLYLFQRLENEVEIGYPNYKNTEKDLDNIDLKEMSNITKLIFSTINFEKHRISRNLNFDFLHKAFKDINKIDIVEYNGPLAYPLLIDCGSKIKQKLIKEKIYLPTYWPNVFNQSNNESFEYYMTNNNIPIPIDQRYDRNDLKRVVDLIKSFI